MPLHWFTTKEGERGVNQAHYVEVMNDVVIPWVQKTSGDKDIVYCFQQVVCVPCNSSSINTTKREGNSEG